MHVPCMTYSLFSPPIGAVMSDYRRYFVPGGTYFFTVVAQNRAPLFQNAVARKLLGDAMRACVVRHPFDIVAIVLLPDHLHALWVLPSGDDRYSMRWNWIKREFTLAWISAGGKEQVRPASIIRQRRRGIWQRRFWEHTIDDETDFETHFDYIHYNPVKHGYATRPRDWPWSSFHRWVKHGHYDLNWAAGQVPPALPYQGGE